MMDIIVVIILAVLLHFRLWFLSRSANTYISGIMVNRMPSLTIEQLESFTVDEFIYGPLELLCRIWDWSPMCCIRKEKRQKYIELFGRKK